LNSALQKLNQQTKNPEKENKFQSAGLNKQKHGFLIEINELITSTFGFKGKNCLSSLAIGIH
jgi:hypothetical protein